MKWASSRSPATATAQSASWNCTAWNAAMGLPNWMRPLTCSTASSTARSHVPRTDAAVSVRWNSTSRSVPACVGARRRRVTVRRGRPRTGRAGCRAARRPVGPARPGRRAARRPTRRTGRRGRPERRRRARRRTAGRRRRARSTDGDRVGEGHPTGRLAERGGRGQRVGVVPRVEVVDARARASAPATSPARTDGSSSARRAASTPPRAANAFAAAAPNSTASSGSSGFTCSTPLSSALDTIMRCTSMVPDATVAAWA